MQSVQLLSVWKITDRGVAKHLLFTMLWFWVQLDHLIVNNRSLSLLQAISLSLILGVIIYKSIQIYRYISFKSHLVYLSEYI